MNGLKWDEVMYDKHVVIFLLNSGMIGKECCKVKITSSRSLPSGIRDLLLFCWFTNILAGCKGPLCMSILLLCLSYHEGASDVSRNQHPADSLMRDTWILTTFFREVVILHSGSFI